MRRWMRLCVVLGLVMAGPGQLFAEQASPWTAEKGWTAQAQGKLLYGAKNLLLGWTELITEPDESIGNDESILVGLVKGIWNAVGHTVGGAFQMLTFPYTQLDVPLPEGGVGWDRSYLQ